MNQVVAHVVLLSFLKEHGAGAAEVEALNVLLSSSLPQNMNSDPTNIVGTENTHNEYLPKSEAKNKPERQGKPWTKKEEKKLIEEFQEGLSGSDLAKAHNRSVVAIAARLVRLKQIKHRRDLQA